MRCRHNLYNICIIINNPDNTVDITWLIVYMLRFTCVPRSYEIAFFYALLYYTKTRDIQVVVSIGIISRPLLIGKKIILDYKRNIMRSTSFITLLFLAAEYLFITMYNICKYNNLFYNRTNSAPHHCLIVILDAIYL